MDDGGCDEGQKDVPAPLATRDKGVFGADDSSLGTVEVSAVLLENCLSTVIRRPAICGSAFGRLVGRGDIKSRCPWVLELGGLVGDVRKSFDLRRWSVMIDVESQKRGYRNYPVERDIERQEAHTVTGALSEATLYGFSSLPTLA